MMETEREQIKAELRALLHAGGLSAKAWEDARDIDYHADRILALKAEAAPAAEPAAAPFGLTWNMVDVLNGVAESMHNATGVNLERIAALIADVLSHRERSTAEPRPHPTDWAAFHEALAAEPVEREPVAWLLEYEIVGTGWVRAHRPGLGSSLWPDEKQVRAEAAKYAKDYFVRLVPLHRGGFVPWRPSTPTTESEEGA